MVTFKAIALLSSIAASANAVSRVYQGCYSSPADLVNIGPYIFQSTGYCIVKCTEGLNHVMALKNGNECWCGDALPSPVFKLGESACNSPCAGYAPEMCGGSDSWSFYLIEYEPDPTSWRTSIHAWSTRIGYGSAVAGTPRPMGLPTLVPPPNGVLDMWKT